MMYNKHHYIDHVGHVQPIDRELSIRFLESEHRQLNGELVQWTVSLAVCKLFNTVHVAMTNREFHFVYHCVAIR